MRKNPEVCFEVDQVENMANWQSVIGWGTYEELYDNEAEQALQILVNRVIPFITSETSSPRFGLGRPHGTMDSRIKTVVFRIKISEVTGRFEKSH